MTLGVLLLHHFMGLLAFQQRFDSDASEILLLEAFQDFLICSHLSEFILKATMAFVKNLKFQVNTSITEISMANCYGVS